MSGEISVVPVTNQKMLSLFIKLPWTLKIYENDPAWIPPLIREQRILFDRKKSYFFEIGDAEFYVAYKDGKPAGRISAHINHMYEKKFGNKTGFFGFFECINDAEVASALFDAAALWLKKQGKSRMEGPQSFSIYDSAGFEVFGESITPVIGLCHYAPYYKDLVHKYKFQKCVDWHCFLVKKIKDFEPYLKYVRKKIFKEHDIEYKYFKKNDFYKRSEEIFTIFNKAWARNWGHLDFTKKQWDMIINDLKKLAVPELTIFAEKDNKTLGFIISLPDVNPAIQVLNGRLYPWRLIRMLPKMKSKKLHTILLGVLPEYRGRNIIDVFLLLTIENGIKLGYTESDCSLIVETNRHMINALKPLRAEIYKTYRIFEKEI